ncbi:MAG: asparagine synthase-related protein [Bacteroidia bacterium]|nr:asparagine synthase-related protein [Bacteroidia bacterium]MDW8158550.1 asparagine synthase-related protein [Bacteroidia bacterium]
MSEVTVEGKPAHTVIAENNWVGLNTVFYNEITSRYSHNINDVIDFDKFDWDYEGLYNYLDWGYCILGRTPIKGVRFLQANEILARSQDGKLQVQRKNWDQEVFFNLPQYQPDDIIEMIRQDILQWEKSTAGPIVIPLSGGYDSRLLASLVSEKPRVHCFTYGETYNQARAREVLFAKQVAQNLNLKWQHIELHSYHRYLQDWYNDYGVASFAGGLYHYEFYNKIKLSGIQEGNVLSGIVGDLWAKKMVNSISSPQEVGNLKLSHGYYIDKTYFTFKHSKENQYVVEYFEKNRQLWRLMPFRVTELVRHKMIFLNYLFRTPQRFGFSPYSPFMNSQIALAMLTVDEKKRKNRLWQKEYFQKRNLDVENKVRGYQKLNYLACHVSKNYPLPPLKPELFKGIINLDYINRINSKIHIGKIPYYQFFFLQNFNNLLLRLKLRPRHKALSYPFYLQYFVLIPLQLLMIQRNEHLCGKRA